MTDKQTEQDMISANELQKALTTVLAQKDAKVLKDILKNMAETKIYDKDIHYFSLELTKQGWITILENDLTISQIASLYKQFQSHTSVLQDDSTNIFNNLDAALNKIEKISSLNEWRVRNIRTK